MPAERSIRVAVDIGGTFTDLEYLDTATGRTGSFKSPTTPHDPSDGLMTALAGASARFGFALGDIGLLIHGTTIATNAVLTRDLPEGALITTAGFEDVLEIGRHARRDVYGLKPEERTVLVPRHRRFGVRERIGARGEIVTPIDMASVDAAIDDIVRSGASVVAVALLNSFTNPAHEFAIRDQLTERLPELAVSCSANVSPEIREFERTSTTVLNALLMPVVQNYVRALQRRIAAAGIQAPLYLVQSNGGATTLKAAAEAPVKLLLSGPSGGVLAAEKTASALGFAHVVGVDMGGTSYDVAIVRDGARTVIAQGEVDGLPLRVPMVDMRTIGAGGGSIVHLDAGGRLQVGPKSAGARPGPVCYRHGGTEPTVTDVNLVLGRLAPNSFLMNGLPLDIDAARHALSTRVAQPLGLDLERTAEGVLSVVVAKLAGAIKLSLFERGLDPRDFALMSFGGAGGLHALDVAQELGMNNVIFPKGPSTFSAHGILQSDIVHDLARTCILPLTPASLPALADLVAGLTADGAALLAADDLPDAQRDMKLATDLRYRGQAFELMVPLDGLPLDATGLDLLRDRFHHMHAQRFSFDDRSETVELVTLRLAAIGRLASAGHPVTRESPAFAEMSGMAPAKAAATPSWPRRAIWLDGGWETVPVYDQEALGPDPVAGPAVIEQAYTTLILSPGWTCRATADGDVVATRDAPATGELG